MIGRISATVLTNIKVFWLSLACVTFEERIHCKSRWLDLGLVIKQWICYISDSSNDVCIRWYSSRNLALERIQSRIFFVSVAETPSRGKCGEMRFQTFSFSVYRGRKLFSHSSTRWILSKARRQSRLANRGLFRILALGFLKRAISELVKHECSPDFQ